MRKDTSSTLLTISAATAAIALVLLLASPLLPLSNPLILQPVQAQTTTMTFQTPVPANGTDQSNDPISVTFYAQGTPSTNPSQVDITNGKFQYEVSGAPYPGQITSVSITNNTRGEVISFMTSIGAGAFTVTSLCSTSDNNIITLSAMNNPTLYDLKGPVECTSSSQGGVDTTAQPSTTSLTGTTTTTQNDSDGDGIPDSSDRCTHNSNPKCFKEGDTTTQQQQQQSSSSNRTGNQTR
jgi:hypothetical protein